MVRIRFGAQIVVGLPVVGNVSVWGSRVLAVRGRTTGEMRTTPVNVLAHGGERDLVAPRGVTQWVRNIRAAGEAELRVGRKVERVRVSELDGWDGGRTEATRLDELRRGDVIRVRVD